ncbi:DUF4870 domain-containing protein [Candidatus Dojkabacteria bacterium]|uniref:DUF4870 domain-containing protein n=1 Tax=Candidatus Dojkabacteria bacterium TaxID=2099670 RepID=A0A955I4I9_9BACT|nr:DUF4870 domain-containing protein [Candidatus Dojkabacteria bacterium]
MEENMQNADSMMESTPAAPSSAPMSGGSSDDKTNAILAWLFAPISSYLLKDQQDPFVKNHVSESFYFGIFSIVLAVVFGVIAACLSILFGSLFGFGLSSILACGINLLWLAVFLVVSVPRLIGIIKAVNHETWTVPYVSEFMKKYIKL